MVCRAVGELLSYHFLSCFPNALTFYCSALWMLILICNKNPYHLWSICDPPGP